MGGWKPLIDWNNKLLNMQGRDLNDRDISDLIVLPIGGVYCGLYKRSLIDNSEVIFPEHVRYEDNYWGSIIKPYITRVAFCNQIGYFYRSNPTSTIHQRNHEYPFNDRVFIEHL